MASKEKDRKFSEEELKEFKEIFNLFDKDGNGKISTDELKEVMTRLGQKVTDKEVKQMIKAADLDSSGFVEFNEFVKMMSKTFDEPLTQEELKEAFRVFDVDNSGTITADELKQVVSKLGIHLSQEEINEMIKAADTSGDGQVQYAEFIEMMLNKQG